jgi:hypothetical protein
LTDCFIGGWSDLRHPATAIACCAAHAASVASAFLPILLRHSKATQSQRIQRRPKKRDRHDQRRNDIASIGICF